MFRFEISVLVNCFLDRKNLVRFMFSFKESSGEGGVRTGSVVDFFVERFFLEVGGYV